MIVDVVRDTSDIGIVERGINFIQDKERRGLVRMNGKQKSQGGHGLFATREVLHVSEPLQRGHSMVLDAVEVRLVGVLDIQITVQIRFWHSMAGWEKPTLVLPMGNFGYGSTPYR